MWLCSGLEWPPAVEWLMWLDVRPEAAAILVGEGENTRDTPLAPANQIIFEPSRYF